mmetsp:Transcript_5335/g.6218  ORF Transcript_5335/g.6218 Transcript_5335/m.6218 type:complete len:186 (+) Transcript_5335:174-731(+)
MKAFFLTFLHILTVSQAFTIPSLPSVRQVSLVPHRMAEETDTIEKPIITVEKVEETKQALTSQITEKKDEEKLSETKILMQKVKDAGVAGIISYAAWEFGFWTVSVPVCIAGYRGVTGHWPDFTNQEDIQKLGAEAFAFVNFARFAVPLRIGLALGTTPWVQSNIVNRFKEDKNEIKTDADQGSE